MSDDGVPGTLPMGDWLFDGYPIRTDRQKHNWSKLDWSRAYIDMGPSPAGNPGPYWHVPWDCDGEELWARLYPKLVTTKWQPLVAQAIIDAKVLASREAADRIKALERELDESVPAPVEEGARIADDYINTLLELQTAQAEASRLREALTPFAEAADGIDDTDRDSIEMWEHPASMQVTAGDFRRARAALEKP